MSSPPSAICQSVIAATAAVSARRMRGPRLTGWAKGRALSRSRSDGEKTALRPDQDRPFAAGRPAERGRLARQRLVTEHQLPVIRPVRKEPIQLLQVADLGDIGAAALFGGLDGMGLKAVLADAFGIGEIRLYGQDPSSTHLGGLFDNEIGAGLLDRREQQPDIRRHPLRSRLRNAQQRTCAFARLGNSCMPLAIAPVEQQHRIARAAPHHPEEIMRLVAVQRNRLPFPQGVIYKKPDLRICHEGTI